MIYADPSFLFSFYALDANTVSASRTYSSDQRRPLIFTPWQRFELRNTVRLAVYRMRKAGQLIPFQRGIIFQTIEQDLTNGILRHFDLEWRDVFRVAEQLSDAYTETTGPGSVDIWHIACAKMLGADSFWTFDGNQRDAAKATGAFRTVPTL